MKSDIEFLWVIVPDCEYDTSRWITHVLGQSVDLLGLRKWKVR